MIQSWKVPPIMKGLLTWVPGVNAWRLRRASTGGSDSARYCYSVWLRHLVTLGLQGFRINGAHVAELGPGDSIGVGLAALLSGATQYVGLDLVPFAVKTDARKIFDELVQLFSLRASIPDHYEFPGIRPRLESYGFPDGAVDWLDFDRKAQRIRQGLNNGLNSGKLLTYRAPW